MTTVTPTTGGLKDIAFAYAEKKPHSRPPCSRHRLRRHRGHRGRNHCATAAVVPRFHATQPSPKRAPRRLRSGSLVRALTYFSCTPAPGDSLDERPVAAQCRARDGGGAAGGGGVGWMAAVGHAILHPDARLPPPSLRKEIRTDSRAEIACQESVSEIITVPSLDGGRGRSVCRSVCRSSSQFLEGN